MLIIFCTSFSLHLFILLDSLALRERYWLSFVFLLLFLDTGCVHLISLMWLEDVIASSSSALLLFPILYSSSFYLIVLTFLAGSAHSGTLCRCAQSFGRSHILEIIFCTSFSLHLFILLDSLLYFYSPFSIPLRFDFLGWISPFRNIM